MEDGWSKRLNHDAGLEGIKAHLEHTELSQQGALNTDDTNNQETQHDPAAAGHPLSAATVSCSDLFVYLR